MADYRAIIDSVCARIIEAGLATSKSTRGCAEVELHDIQRHLAVELPESYKYFMQKMGRGAGNFLVGSDWTYPQVIHLWQHSQALLKEDQSSFHLGPKDVVFAMHQGYSFLFFHAEDSNPTVFIYVEGKAQPSIVAATFTDWLSNCAEGEITEWARRNG